MNNKDFLKGMSQTMSKEFQDKLPQTMSETGIEVYEMMNDYPSMKNEFIDTLTNKIIMQKFHTKVFNNPLKMFHKGQVPFGSTIENIFVESAISKGLNEHFEENGSVENDLIGVKVADVKVSYMTKNFEYRYKVTISELQLKTAFMDSIGLSKLLTDLLTSITNGAYFDEFEDMRNLLKEVANGNKLVKLPSGKTTTVKLTSSEIKKPMKKVSITGFDSNPKILSETVRALTGRLKFPSTEYNMSGVKTWSENNELVFISTPEIIAKLDVNVLADCFNVSKADLQTRTVQVDELPTKFASAIGVGGTSDEKCLGLLVDSEFLQMYDTIMTMKKFDNGANLTVNHFLHKHGILANCYFKNAIAIVEG